MVDSLPGKLSKLNSFLNQISVLIHWQAGEKDSSSNRSSNRKRSFALYAVLETIDRLRYFGQYARWYQSIVMIGVLLNSGILVITKPIGAQIIHKFSEFCAPYRLYQITIRAIPICACNVPFGSGSCQHDYRDHFQFI